MLALVHKKFAFCLQVTHIKEEPISADEVTGDEDDPLNFHSITIKRESTDGFIEEINEPEDIKPNLQQLKEIMESQYTPKRLKSGKVNCEACRVSFLNDVCYEKHTLSMRHKINLKLFRSGKAPTRSRGKALIKAIMGSSYECPKPKVKGYFQCNQCPSRYLHARNLTTHQKKHKMEIQDAAKVEQKGLHFQEASESSQDSTQSSKPPQRLSALNVKFVTKEELKCELCNRYFGTTSALYSHRRYCGFSGSHSCSRCNQKFSTQSLMFKHRRECVTFSRKQSLIKSHSHQSNNIPTNIPSQEIPQVPLDGTVLACTLCNLTFRNSPDLISHMQLNHMDFGKQKSAFEVPTFNEPNNINRKNNSQMHYCKYCMKSFSSQMSMSCHSGYHARARLYYCKFCPENYTDKLMIRQHMKIHIADPSLNKNICWICYTPFASQQDLSNHKNIHVNMKIKIFSCGICGNSYNTKELLVKHRKNTHRPQKPIEDFDTSQLEPLPESVIKETAVELIDEDYKLFKCRICKKKFCSKGNLRRHSLVHKRTQNIDMSIVKVENPFQNRCNWCLQSFKNNVGLANHRPFCVRYKIASAPLSSFTGKGPVKCKGCKKWYSSKSSLYKHRKRCTGKPLVQTNMVEISHLSTQNCPNCDQQFLSEESLNRHKQHCKPSIDRVTCDCGEIFTSVEQKLAHADSCPANCTCKKCSMKFNSPEELESHQSICQSQPLLSPPVQSSFALESRSPSVGCSKCNKKFVYSKCLKLHEEKCLNESWPCQICKEIFSSELALANHKKYRGQCQNLQIIRSPSTSSLNEGPTFKCEHCSMKFISGNELKQHSMTCGKTKKRRNYNASFEERRFSCDQCDKRFLWSANLYRHKKNSHATTFSANENSDNKTVSSTTGSPARPNQEGGSGYFRCHLCPDIIFHKKQGFLEHQLAHNRQLEKSIVDQIENEDSDLLTCELCDKKLPESLYHMHMDEHMNDDFEETHTATDNLAESSSTPVQTFPCDLCGKEFHSNSSRKSHRAAHYRNNSVFGIEGLSSIKEQKMSYKKRFKAKHVRCMTCYKLLSVNSMPKHKMMHHREAAEFFGESQSKSSQQAPIPRSSTPSLNDSPDQNGSADFNTTPESLLSLRLEDTGDGQQTFPCPKCDRVFIIRKTLTEHLKVHQDDSMETESTSSATGNVDQYTYKCVYCDLSWKYKSVYERHLSSKKHLEIQKQLSSII